MTMLLGTSAPRGAAPAPGIIMVTLTEKGRPHPTTARVFLTTQGDVFLSVGIFHVSRTAAKALYQLQHRRDGLGGHRGQRLCYVVVEPPDLTLSPRRGTSHE